jgi:uncharacterized protein (TIGR04255 family)
VARSLPPLSLPNSPLVYVIGQVRFSSIESMSKYVPEIQDELRRQGLPRFVPGKIQQLRFNPLAHKMDVDQTDRWEFQNPDRTEGLILVKDFIALQVSKYTSFERFCELFKVGLYAVHRAASIGLVERVGLRYVDLIVPDESERFSDYFIPALLGPEKEPLEVDDALYSMQFQGKTPAGTLMLKLSQHDDGTVLPLDLNPSTLQHTWPARNEKQKLSLLDFDHYIEFADRPKAFSVDLVLDLLWRLHHHTDVAFRYAVKPEAIRKWQGEMQ